MRAAMTKRDICNIIGYLIDYLVCLAYKIKLTDNI